MPTYQLKAPDGKTYRIQGPPGATAEQVKAEILRRNPDAGRSPTFNATKKQGRDTALGFASGLASRFNEAIPLADELAAAGGTAVRLGERAVRGELNTGNALEAVGQEWRRQRETQQGLQAGAYQRSPTAANLATGTAYAAQAALPAGQVLTAPSRLAGAVRGAGMASLQAGTNALAGRGTLQERSRAAGEAMTNPLVLGLGAGVGALGPVAPKAAKPGKPAMTSSALADDVRTLEDIGVQTSIPQRMGGAAKNAEDLTKRAPLVGDAVKGMRDRQIEQLNRGVALKALEPIGVKLPKDIKPGFDTVQFVDEAIGKVYDDAAQLVPVVAPQAKQGFVADLQQIAQRKVDLDPSEAARFDAIMGDRLARLGQQNVSGATVKEIHSTLGKLQGEAAKKGSDTLASMIGDVRRALMKTIEASNPQARDMIRQADEAWSVYSVMNDAAAASTLRGGVFGPSQLNSASRASAKRLGSNMAGKGRGTLQDIATAGGKVLSDQYGNPGTSNALLGFGAGSGLTAGLSGAMGPQAQAGAALTTAAGAAVATPYMLAARKVLESLPQQPTAAQMQNAVSLLQQIGVKDPQVRAIAEQLAARLSRGVSAQAGGQAAQSALPQ